MSIINFQEALRARIYQMADEHLQMQEAIMDLPDHEVPAALARLEAHSIELSRLARRLEESRPVVQEFKGSSVQSQDGRLNSEPGERLNLEPLNEPEEPEVA